MPSDRVAAVVGKAILNPEFRQKLLDDADAALAGFDLSEAERALVTDVNLEALAILGTILDAPLSQNPLFGGMGTTAAPRVPA